MPGISSAADSSYDRTVLYPGPLNVWAPTGWMPAIRPQSDWFPIGQGVTWLSGGEGVLHAMFCTLYRTRLG